RAVGHRASLACGLPSWGLRPWPHRGAPVYGTGVVLLLRPDASPAETETNNRVGILLRRSSRTRSPAHASGGGFFDQVANPRQRSVTFRVSTPGFIGLGRVTMVRNRR